MTPRDPSAAVLRVLRAANRLAAASDRRAFCQDIAQALVGALGLTSCTIELTGVARREEPGARGAGEEREQRVERASSHAGTMPPPDLEVGLEVGLGADAGPAQAITLPIAWGERTYGALTLVFRGGERPLPRETAEELAADLGLAVHGMERADAAPSQAASPAHAARDARANRGDDALDESEERFRLLVESIEDVVFRIDVDGNYAYASPATRRFGYEPEELLGQAFGSLIHPEDLSRMIDAFARVLVGEIAVVECRIRCADGGYRHVRASSRRMVRGQEIVGVAGLLVDISQQRETENQLRAAQKMEAVGRLAGGIAHDFNNLLSVIGAFAELALDSVRESDPLHADLAEILKATRRATALTRQLLAFSRKQTMQAQVLDLNELVSGLEKMLRRMIGENIDLVVVPGPDLRRIKADPGQLEQVLMNLVINARDAIASSGAITLTTTNTRLDGHDSAHLGLPLGAYVLLSVTDTGVGMDEAVLRQLFEPFFTTKEAGKGTGLGLATAYGIVKQSGGAITVRSSPGKGATFRIWLPAVDGREEAESSPDASHKKGAASRGHGTILVVEDEEGVRTLVRRVLVSAGYTVLVAANGGEALLLCEERPDEIDLMLSDVVMPGMSGPALARRLASLQPKMRVLFMSGYAREHGDAELSAAPLIDKPFTVEALVGRVRSMLEAPGSLRSPPASE